MANASIPGLPVAVTLDGSEQLELVQPAGSGGTSKRATAAQIGNTANFGTLSLGISGLAQLNAPNATQDFLAILHNDGIVYKISPSGLSLVTGNMPAGGTVSQFLIKNSSTNYDTLWATMTGDVSMSGTSAFTAAIATAAVTYAKFQQVTGLSVPGVAGTPTGVMAALTGVTDQVLRVAANGTSLGFGQVNLSAAAAITGFLTSSFMTGILAARFGGTGTSALTAHGVVLGNGTSAVSVSSAPTSAQVFLGQGASADPTWNTMVGDVTIGATGTATIANNAVTYAKFQTITALSIHGNTSSVAANSTAIPGTADQVLRVASSGTSLGFGQINLSTAAAVTGTLSVSLGGTGFTTAAATGVLFGNGTGAIQVAAVGSAKNVFVVNAAGTGIGWGQVDLSTTAAITGALTSPSPATILSTTAIPANGSTGNGYKLSSVTNFGIFFGSGAPSLSAATGSLYLRSDGSTTTSRLYVNTNGSTTWTPMVSNT